VGFSALLALAHASDPQGYVGGIIGFFLMTSDVNMINLQVMAEDQIALDKSVVDAKTGKTLYAQNIANNSKHYFWQGEFQTLPIGMDDEPVQFAQKLREALPEVNNLRLNFNEFSFDENGKLHPQFTLFLKEAAAQGFEFTFTYASGDAQNIGNAGSQWGHTALTNANAYAALEQNFGDIQGAWESLLDWLDKNEKVADAIYGFEMMNEPAGYRHSIRANGNGDGYTDADFIKLYADHVIALSDFIQNRADAKILVGGWGYSGDFATLNGTLIGDGDPVSALEYIRAGIGDALVWSAHLYPGWAGTDNATSGKALQEVLEKHFAPILSDDVLVTETNADGSVDNFNGGDGITDFFTTMYEWFAENDIGIGWFPGVETGNSNFVVIDQDGTLRFLHQHSYAHGMNAFSIGETDASLAGDDRINVTLIEGKLRNESYETDYGPDTFDAVQFLGTAFTYEGDDTIIGTDLSNDFAYGGFGNDSIYGGGGDDFLFGQQGNDKLFSSGGINHLFGGSGNDRLIGGSGFDQMRGGTGKDLFASNGAGHDVITDFSTKDDMIDLRNKHALWEQILQSMVKTDADSDGKSDDVEISLGSGNSLILLNVKLSNITAEHFVGAVASDGKVDGTNTDDLIGRANFADGQGEAVTNRVDVIYGYNGDDTIRGHKGSDTIFGGSGSDELLGDAGNDILFGGQTREVDTLVGNRGKDALYGEGGQDYLSGSAGNDQLNGGRQNDVLSGGKGADEFHFISGDGSDVITDFNLNNDTVHFEFGETYRVKENADGTLIIYGDGDKVLLQDHFVLTDADMAALEAAIFTNL
jgi:Ca2+-binding RTX toxin-like protein